MDEHIVVDGAIRHLPNDIIDINLNNLTWWVDKHNNYASREAIEILLGAVTNNASPPIGTSKQAARKRWVKDNIYSRLPLGIRAISYFFYRYFLRLGFLDGWQGFAFHSMQGFWYRFLVDLKVSEIQMLMKKRGETLEEVVKTELGYEI